MYDVLSGKDIFVQCPILCVACDNARALEICHHLGSTARHFCRDCDVCLYNHFWGFLTYYIQLLKVPDE